MNSKQLPHSKTRKHIKFLILSMAILLQRKLVLLSLAYKLKFSTLFDNAMFKTNKTKQNLTKQRHLEFMILLPLPLHSSADSTFEDS